jgi:DNA (cytosine-5)-methyltransferase 1
MINNYEFPYSWTLKDSNFTKDKGKVFSCFACGGGSTMGYKLAGFDVIGHNDIDKKMVEVYKENHKPKYSFLESITTFAKRKDLPSELYELDILDGSPPCSSFSMAGNREKDWGKKKIFKEGQSDQVLDTLFFDFIDLAKELQPKVVIAENVKGLLLGNAREYVRNIYKAFDEAGYYCQHFLFDASKMGVPQRRERVFFISLRKDLSSKFLYQQDMFTIKPKIEFDYKKPGIIFEEIYQKGVSSTKHTQNSPLHNYWKNRKLSDTSIGEIVKRVDKRFSMLSVMLIHNHNICPTFTRQDRTILYEEYRSINKNEACLVQSFPIDYNFITKQWGYIIGMSVPPIMIAQIASQVYDQWLNKL